ncbi:ribosomal protein S18-alanine N-acetyltransferase [Halomonas sp. GXIMD04776]|uniref:ribosomal protein S18-alanine N-acetyltransferase n=1 Tax=Halomonas sp. GXIMD04776 TaxID=3415605 RepID=UPI003CA8ECBA
MTLRLEPLTSQWLARVVEIENAGQLQPWTRTQFRQAFEDERAILWGAFEDDALVAYALLYRLPFDAELQAIAVIPEVRRRGIAQALLERLVAEANCWNNERLLLEVRASNQAAYKLYEKQGFKLDGRRRGYYRDLDGRWEDALLMSRRLATAGAS